MTPGPLGVRPVLMMFQSFVSALFFPYFPSILADPARHDGAVPYYDGVMTRILTCASVDSRLWAVFPLSR